MDTANILLVDDEKMLLDFMYKTLSGNGYNVRVAESGKQGLALFVPGFFDVVVSDVRMPDMDGIEMVRRILKLDPHVVPVIVTAFADQQTAVRAMECGVQRFLAKPFEYEELKAKVDEAMGERKRILEVHSKKEQLESQLIYAERLSVLGQLAPQIGHELKTPLQLIQGHAELAMLWLKKKEIEKAMDSVGRIQPAVRKMVALIRQMFSLGKPTENRQEELDLRAELDKILDPLQGLGTLKHCQIVRDYADPLPCITGDPAQIEQVFQNLIVNAAQAMEHAKEQVLTLRVISNNGWVEARVEDSGSGISEEHMNDIFQPFFTTKPDGKGTGLGLTIVRMVLERHGGTIRVESSMGVGSQFIVTLPVEPDRGLGDG